MTLSNASQEKLLFASAGAIALYLLWKKAGNTLAPVTDTIADAWLAATLPADVTVNAAFVLPDGRVIAAQSIDANFMFTFGGKRYRLTGRDSLNRYVAVAI